MKKHFFKIILIILGLVLISISSNPEYAYLKVVGSAVLLLAIILFFTNHGKKNNSNQYPTTQSFPKKGEIQTQTYPVADEIKSFTPIKDDTANKENEEKKTERLNKVIDELKPLISDKIWGTDDINHQSSVYLKKDSEIEYVAKALSLPALNTSVWDLNQKMNNNLLTENEIIKILEFGTDSIIDDFFSNYSDSTSWKMSNSLLEKLIIKNPLFLYRFNNLNRDLLSTIIDKLSAYELLGYRINPKKSGENSTNSFLDLKNSTDDKNVYINYYEVADTDMVYFLEQNYSDEKVLRQLAFNKIVDGSNNLVDMINRLDDIDKEEFKQIFARSYQQEIDALFERSDSTDFINLLPVGYAVKAVLEIIKCDFDEEIKDNYDFSSASEDDYSKLIEELSPDELLGYDKRGSGNYDFIYLLEEQDVKNDKIRILAFDKMFSSSHLTDGIERWNDLTEYEIKKIIESGNDSLINELSYRSDTGDIIEKFPDEFIIKARLGLFEFSDSDDLNDEYESRMVRSDFKEKVKNLVKSL